MGKRKKKGVRGERVKKSEEPGGGNPITTKGSAGLNEKQQNPPKTQTGKPTLKKKQGGRNIQRLAELERGNGDQKLGGGWEGRGINNRKSKDKNARQRVSHGSKKGGEGGTKQSPQA